MNNFGYVLTALMLVSASVGAALAHFLPWLWQVFKPYIHAFTA